jgi:F-type H+-transporting ATPase subunit delta
MAKQVDSTYGTALFEAGKEKNLLPVLLTQAREVMAALDENPDLTRVLTHPDIEKDEKCAMIQNIFDGRVEDVLTGLLLAAVNKNHGGRLSGILGFFVKLTMEELGIGEAYVTSAVELREEQKQEVCQKLIQTTGYKEMEMHYTVDGSIIGGLIIRIGDRIVDSSIQTQLASLKKSLIN